MGKFIKSGMIFGSLLGLFIFYNTSASTQREGFQGDPLVEIDDSLVQVQIDKKYKANMFVSKSTIEEILGEDFVLRKGTVMYHFLDPIIHHGRKIHWMYKVAVYSCTDTTYSNITVSMAGEKADDILYEIDDDSDSFVIPISGSLAEVETTTICSIKIDPVKKPADKSKIKRRRPIPTT